MAEHKIIIPGAVRRCLSLFTAINEPVSDASPDMVEQKRRLKLWSQSFGAHCIDSGTPSLEYRLRNAPRLRRNIVNLLQDLAQLLEDRLALRRGTMMPWEMGPDYSEAAIEHIFGKMETESKEHDIGNVDDTNTGNDADNTGKKGNADDADDADNSSASEDVIDGVLEPCTEEGQIELHIRDTLDCIMNLSIPIQNPAQPILLTPSSAVDSDDEIQYTEHARQRYPNLPAWKTERLDQAICKRRLLFRHFRTQDNMIGTTQVSSNMNPAPEGSSDVAIMSKAKEQNLNRPQRLPRLREAFQGIPFKCPYCRFTIVVQNNAEWRSHVFQDLKPYICLQDSHSNVEYEFAHSRDWINHMLQWHWVNYRCPLGSCEHEFPEAHSFRAHIMTSHSYDIRVYGMEVLVRLARLDNEPEIERACPFCQEMQSLPQTYERHVGRHMEDLSFFTLPRLDGHTQEILEMDEEEPATTPFDRKEDNDREVRALENFNIAEFRQAASDGDVATVARMLQLVGSEYDAVALDLAAECGHDKIVELLLSFGGFHPDQHFSSPILAAIGGSNVRVIELLVQHEKFDPTKKYRRLRYYEIAKQRKGPHWEEEVRLLEKADREHPGRQTGKSRPYARTRSMIPASISLPFTGSLQPEKTAKQDSDNLKRPENFELGTQNAEPNAGWPQPSKLAGRRRLSRDTDQLYMADVEHEPETPTDSYIGKVRRSGWPDLTEWPNQDERPTGLIGAAHGKVKDLSRPAPGEPLEPQPINDQKPGGEAERNPSNPIDLEESPGSFVWPPKLPFWPPKGQSLAGTTGDGGDLSGAKRSSLDVPETVAGTKQGGNDTNFGHGGAPAPGYGYNGPPQHGGYGGPPPPQGAQQFGHGAPQGYTFQYSNCSGRRKALLIGINYFGQKGELRGCINDVRNVSRFLNERHGYRWEDIVILTDDQQDPHKIPTKQNMQNAMDWLVTNTQPNDALFFHYSGHGGQTEDLDGDEDDGFNEVIYPVDFQRAGHIVDDEIHYRVVRPLKPGVRLTAIFDSCYSATAMDLPYVYSTKGVLKEPNLAKEASQGLLSAVGAYKRGDLATITTTMFGFAESTFKGDNVYKKTKQTRTSPADVVMWSGSRDDQTFANAIINAQATGAMSWAFITAIKQNPNQSYVQLLNSIRDVLASKYTQKPQLSCSHPLDTNLLFIM